MTEKELTQILDAGRISMAKRDELVEAIIKSPRSIELTGHLLHLVFEEDKTDLWQSSWVFDNVMRKKLSLLFPHIDAFCTSLSSLKSESVIRPMAHTCELLILKYFKKKDPSVINSLKTKHLEEIAEACFDWLIGQHKVASKVFAMTSLFYLGEKLEWIRPELKLVIEQQIAEGTAGFKSRGSKTLALLTNLGV